jgi:hypothetical protein
MTPLHRFVKQKPCTGQGLSKSLIDKYFLHRIGAGCAGRNAALEIKVAKYTIAAQIAYAYQE